MTDTTEQTPAITAHQLYKKLAAVYAEIAVLEGDAKELLTEGKDADLDVSFINAIAKADAKGKIGALEEKSQKTLDMIEELRG